MQAFGNERKVQQGESWNLDILVSQSSTEYIPFIVSSERQNPMWAITVASTKYEKSNRYVATWWENLNDLPRFKQTVPEYLGEYNSREDAISGVPIIDKYDYLYQYTLTTDSLDVITGHKPYYYYYVKNVDGADVVYTDYECRIRMQFESTETSQWGSQNYLYQITLVDTVPMVEHVVDARETYPDLEWAEWPDYPLANNTISIALSDYIIDNISTLYSYIKRRIPDWFQPDIDENIEVGIIKSPQVILAPTKLQVENNLRTII